MPIFRHIWVPDSTVGDIEQRRRQWNTYVDNDEVRRHINWYCWYRPDPRQIPAEQFVIGCASDISILYPVNVPILPNRVILNENPFRLF